jgi:hypothetical protein
MVGRHSLTYNSPCTFSRNANVEFESRFAGTLDSS